MSSNRTYVYAGTTKLGNTTKIHFTNDRYGHQLRLLASGSVDPQFVRLPNPMTRKEASAYMMNMVEDEGAKMLFASVASK